MTGLPTAGSVIPAAGPMFASDPGPVDVAYLALAAVGLGAGLLWLRRIAAGEPEGGSFRSTASPRRDPVVIVAIHLAVVLAGLAAFAIVTR